MLLYMGKEWPMTLWKHVCLPTIALNKKIIVQMTS